MCAVKHVLAARRRIARDQWLAMRVIAQRRGASNSIRVPGIRGKVIRCHFNHTLQCACYGLPAFPE